MKRPLLVRTLTAAEQEALEQGLRSREAFTLRRCQILLASAKGYRPSQIAHQLGCTSQTVRNTIHAFNGKGVSSLVAQSSRPKTAQPIFDIAKREQLRSLLHISPRTLGKSRSTWTLKLLAQVCYEQGLTGEQVSLETIRQALKALDINWHRAKAWITSPDPQYSLKKRQRERLMHLARSQPDWELGFLDEVWWSRLSQPQMHGWAEETPLRLEYKPPETTDTDPKAIACYGLWCKDSQQMLLRFVDGRPVSDVTCAFLEWVCQSLSQRGKRVLALVWDNASWHLSKKVRQWIKTHNAQAKRSGGVRLVVCHLPVKSPWLNPIEPKWLHGKRAIVEPERKLSAQELTSRICDFFGCQLLEPLQQKVC
jgi:transposase